MISIPALSGALLAGFEWVHLPLLLFWWIGYFCYQAMALWLKSRRKPKYFPPVRAYAIAAVPFAAMVAVMRPYLVFWVLAFLPLISTAVWCSIKRKERSVLNDTVTVLAACLMVPVAFHAAASQGDPRWGWVWTVFAIEFAYFWGTIPHVKALIRERNRPEVARFSVYYYGAVTVVVTILAILRVFAPAPLGGWALVLVWVALTARAYVMPSYQRANSPLKPMVIGVTEVVFSLLLAYCLLG